jgi:hypothetical protein
MGSLPNDSLLFALDIKSLDNIFFSYHVVGLVPSHSHKSLILMYMYIKFFVQFDVNWLCTLLWTNEYEFQSIRMMMWNTLAPKCDEWWVQVCFH